MFKHAPGIFLLSLIFRQYAAAALSTWPAPTDDLEDILFLKSGYRARGFAQAVTPCTAGASPGRIAAAEWIRTAFHDMATGNTFTQVGGLDGSIQFEITSAENSGQAFKTSLLTYEPFFSSQTSLSDIIAAGVYTATRSCGGPVIPVRGGRIDATAAGPVGNVPLPQNAISIFRNQFLRFGYNATEMIEFTACGHTLGGVHSESFPEHVPPGSAPNNVAQMDTTPASFDNRIAVEFVDKSTRDPLQVSNTRQNSDLAVFSSDTGNATIQSLTDATTFQNRCKEMFQKMIDTVPGGVALTGVIEPYEVKPYDLQLYLLDGGSGIRFTGDVRIRTTQRPASSITSVQLLYKDRTGNSASNSITTIYKGNAQGFDDTFAFYSFNANLPADTGISSFSVKISGSGGDSTFDNNGAGFQVDDSVLLQTRQSCLDEAGQLTAVAAVRDGASSPSLQVIMKIPRPSPSVIPSLSTTTIPMATQSAVGAYQLYSASYTFPTGPRAETAEFSLSGPDLSENLRKPNSLPTACSPLGADPTSQPPSSNYTFEGCYSDSGPVRALSALTTASPNMTIETCSTTCNKYQFFGLEYGSECYCGNALDSSSSLTPLSDCNMPCAGDASQYCGAGFRLSTYKNLDYVAPETPALSGYAYEGCIEDSIEDRVLQGQTAVIGSLTYATCAEYCTGYAYFGVEFGTECYCGRSFDNSTVRRPEIECDMPCTGDERATCGAPYRISVFRANGTFVVPQNPTIPGYNYSGCYTDSVGERVLQKEYYFDEMMTVEKCKGYCDGTKYFGTQYGGECYCGDEFAFNSTVVSDSECSFLCGGDRGEFCGAANRLSLWTKLGNETSSK